MSANPSGFAAYCDQQMARWNVSSVDAPDTFSREIDSSLLSHVTHTNWWETEGQDLPHRPQPQRRRWSSSDSDASDDLYMRPTPTGLRNRHQSSNRANEMLGWHQRDQSWPLQCPSNAVAPLRYPFPSDGWSPRPASTRDAIQSPQITDSLQPPPLHELWFLDRSPKGTATLTFLDEHGNPQSISHVDLKAIEQSCPLLAVAFEQSRSGPQLFLQTLTTKTAIPFLEFLHTDSYRVAGPNGSYAGDVPTSVLLHCQMYHLGDMYAVEQLKTQAYANVFRQCEFACSSPNQPIDLCAAIRFLYGSLPTHEGLINTVIDYCVSRFLEHNLGQDDEFKQLAYDLRPFHQALCRNSRERNFDHEGKSPRSLVTLTRSKTDLTNSRHCHHPTPLQTLRTRYLRFARRPRRHALRPRCLPLPYL
ncbi:hypothetical protein BDY17DRAFT_17542 [Neohortaea acidophila]|uniref:BTB domain-containing protein n=1 Tax=Neohortaea acidophila TaxID=245834 RepID=A0A6A6Q612_9PEZI|nr:uncharacterized protein BDY17DRAFT_17542 [Neohortaea acidophila]KAF2487755.1 hypothetical protein BDY17DRAFT_17542 [Neohortaea acidophila]